MSTDVWRVGSDGLEVLGRIRPEYAAVLTGDALSFVADLTRAFEGPVGELLARRQELQARFDAGERPGFLAETAPIRESEWQVAALPPELLDRRVEITGPTDRKMIINALNSGASVFMADLEDANAPTWDNMVGGQLNLREAVRGTLRYVHPETGRVYALEPQGALLMVRPRGWHLVERHLRVDGRPVPAALFDFGLFFYHNAHALLAKGAGPYFYLPKLESHLEARLWNEIFLEAQAALGLARGTIRATVLIETLPAAFEMDEILWELKEHSAGLNCGRWDYIFSFIKKLSNDPDCVLPDRQELTMNKGFLRAYSQLLIQTCHRRGVHAMGGMAAQIPIKDDPLANEQALEKVRADKRREAWDGHDGTWVAHPGLVPVARQIFDAFMPGPNQIDLVRDDVRVTSADLLRVPEGRRTRETLRANLRVAVQYLEAWLSGQGCVPLDNLMEDAATAEIARAQVWQWVHHRVRLQDGELAEPALLERALAEELERIRGRVGEARYSGGRFSQAAELVARLAAAPKFTEFLTLPAYEMLEAMP